KIVLELGGNAGIIVSDECDFEAAVKKSVISGYSYSGQTCIHAQRIFVQEKLYDKFVANFAKGASQLIIGDPMSDDTDMSVMIDEENAVRVEEWVNEAVNDGAEIILGGKRIKNLYKPTIITKANSSMKICSKEVFGPVVTIDSFKSFDEAILKMNDTPFGLQAGVFTNRISEMNKAFNELEVGGVILNDGPSFRVDHMPYGGIKDSGFGREGVKYAIMDMMEARILVK
ncbi:MAG: aldehyde dehydrogenase family protein, partial [Methanococcaceae archaeon]